MSDIHDDLFATSARIRYVALASGQDVVMRSRADLTDASGEDSDRFEELLVNPTLITLAGQRGDIDCGGLRFLVVGYGHFNQLVIPLTSGHLSIAFERNSDPIQFLSAVFDVIAHHGYAHRDALPS